MSNDLRAVGAFLAVILFAFSAQCQTPGSGWTEYRNERFGIRMLYPADLKLEKTAEAGDGHIFASADGSAKLLVGALPNETKQAPAQYQAYVASHSYAGYRVQYRPLAQNWFVLSGEGSDKTFYEKVMFSCDGRLINSFALLYPTDQRATYDPIVERMERSFRPGTQCDGLAPDTAQQTTRLKPLAKEQRQGPRSALADRIARERGYDVIVVLRRNTPPYDRRVVRGYVSQ